MDLPQQPATPSGFTMLDGAALVLGAAVSSVHLRPFAARGLFDGSLGLFWPTFVGVAITACGPFVLLERWFWRRSPDYPDLGDLLWAVLGLPWVLTSMLIASASSHVPLALMYRPAIMVLIGLSCVITMSVVIRQWILNPPSPTEPQALPEPWTARVGLTVAYAWPLQCALAMVVISPG
ncbi:MAG TPA: hypothetical protein VFT74_18375 [Isosphaeraceae bacterium]|nr:hypothetical protein [Isosphaeraceae bacterium]